jgi:hypothetical protein
MKKYIFILSVIISLFSCNKKISIEKKWVTTDNNYLLLTQPNDSLSYHWEGGVFENVIHGKGTLSAYYDGRQISSRTIEAYYGAISKEDIVLSGDSKYIGSIIEEKFSGFGVLVKPTKIYIGNFLEGQPNGYLSYYVHNKLSYRGEWQNGKRWGRGADYDENGKIVSGIWKDNKIFETDTTITFEEGVYKGLLRNSLPQGYGTMNYFSNEQYNGYWDKGKWQGEGSFTSATDTIIGEFSQGKLNGYGIYKTINFILEGDFKDDKPNGQAYILFSDSTFYSGGWMNGKMDGNGDILQSNGDTYMGGWKDNQYNGEGRYNYHTGEVYDGHWKNGQQDSLGKYICKDYTYLGNWEEGWMNGHGKITYPNGDYYEGDFVENQKYGIGYYHFKDGNTYDGEFVNGKFNGLGIFTFKNGSRYQGEFRDGKIKGDGTLYLKEGKETITITANWDGSIKFPKKASILFENGDLYEGELDNNGFPTQNGTWTSEQDRKNQISTVEKGLSKANEFYKKHKNTWNNIVFYTSIVLTAVELTAPVVASVIAFTPAAPLAPAIGVIGVGAGKANTALNAADAALAMTSASIDVYEGVRDNKTEEAKESLKTLSKEVAINAAFVLAPKALQSKPARKLAKKLSNVARQVGKTAIHITKNKTFGKVVKLAKNSSGVVEKQWIAVAKGIKEGSERLTKFVHHSFKSSVEKTNRISKKLNDLSNSKNIVHAPKGSKNMGWNEGLNETLKPNTLHHIGDHQYYKTDKLGRVDNVTAKLESKVTGRNVDQQVRSVYQKDGNWLGKMPDGRVALKDDGGHLIANVLGGAGEQINYVPMLRNLNRGAYKNMENTLVKAAKEGKEVCMDIKLIYKGSSKRPDKLIVHYTIDGVPYKRIFSNKLPIKK